MFSNRFQPGPPCSQECWLGTNEAPYLKGDKIEVSKLKGFLLKQLQLCSWSHFLHPFFHCKISRQLGPSPHHWQVQWRERHRQAPKHLTFHKHDDNSRRPNQPRALQISRRLNFCKWSKWSNFFEKLSDLSLVALPALPASCLTF